MGNETSTPTNSIASIALTPPAQKRRIVKAVKPAPVHLDADDEKKEEKQDDETRADDADEETREGHAASTATVKIQPKTKAKREFKLQQHRLTSKQQQQQQQQQQTNNNTEETNNNTEETNETTIPPTRKTPSPNPMSRFMSAFSVESKHPEHKRKQFAETAVDPEDTPKQPLEKRLKGEESIHSDNDDTSSSVRDTPLPRVVLVAAACVVGIAALVAWRLKKR